MLILLLHRRTPSTAAILRRRLLLPSPSTSTSTRRPIIMTNPSPTRQGNLNSFVKGGSNNKGKGKADKSEQSAEGGNKRPRPDGTDVPPEAKKPKSTANGGGTHKAFPANPPEPNEVEDGETVLAKLDRACEAQKGVEVSLVGKLARQKTERPYAAIITPH